MRILRFFNLYIMKHIRYVLVCLVLLSNLSILASNPKREFRSTWLATVASIDWPNVKNNEASQKAALDDILDALEQANMNAVCFQVRSLCDAMYKSSYEPWSSQLTGSRGKDPGYDPLAYLIEEAHKRGIEVHAWVNPFRYETSAGAFGTEDPVRKRMSKYILSYSNGSFSGTILDPGRPEVREYNVQVAKEIVENYDIDGMLFDDYFYPYGGTTNEDAESKAIYKTDPNQTDTEWRCENIDKAMKAYYDMIQETKPWVRFGIAPFGIWTVDSKWADKYDISLPSGIIGMDALKTLACNTISWMDGGYVDYISPQLYWSTQSSGQSYITLSKWWSDMAKLFTDKRTDGKKIHFFSSNADYQGYGNAEMGLEIDYNRQYDQLGAPGAIFYNTNQFIATGLPAYLSANQFSTLALPPTMDWKEAEALAAPTNLTLNGSTLSWTHPTAERFTVYAYTKGTSPSKAMADPSNLVGVVYGKSIDLSHIDRYPLRTLAVCAYDRYGNEYTAAFHNEGEVTPALAAMQTAITIVGKENFPQPYKDIKIVGEGLTADISIETTASDVFTIEKRADWDERLGGTLRVYLNTTLPAGDYTGSIVATSNSLRVEVDIKATIIPLVPVLAASEESLVLTGTQNPTKHIYRDVTITAEDLLSDITISSSTPAVTYECLEGWNARTGGILRVALNTSMAVGDYTGSIFIQSNTLRVEIDVKATITPLVSILTSSVSDVSLTVMQNASRRCYQDVIITAEDLVSDITISSTMSVVTYECLEDWDVSTGGVLRLHLNTLEAVGTYTGIITLQSGEIKTDIAVRATITEYIPEDTEPQAGTVTLTALWNKSNTNENRPAYIGTSNDNRSIVYYDNLLYIPAYPDQRFYIVDANTGNLISTKTLGVGSQYHSFNLCISDDGQLFSGNSNLSNAISIYAVDKVDGGARKYSITKQIGRSDYFDVYGSWTGSGYIVSHGNAGKVLYIPFSNSTLYARTTKVLDLGLNLGTNISARALACDENSFYVNGGYSIPTKHSVEDGKLLESFGDEQPATGIDVSGMGIFTLRGSKYMLTPANGTGSFDLFNITNGLGEAKRVIEPTPSLGNNTNRAYTIDFATYVEGNDAYIYVLAPNNGVAAYKLTFTPSATTTVENIAVPMATLHTLSDGVLIRFAGKQTVKIYSINGILLHSAMADGEYTATLQQGMYIIQVGNEIHKFIK